QRPSSKNDHPQLDEKANSILSICRQSNFWRWTVKLRIECSDDDDNDIEQSKESAEKTQDEESSQDSCTLGDEEASAATKVSEGELPEDSDRSNTERSTDEWSNGSVGSVDEEMAAAVEREFLGL
ncbi:hypothetical protein MRX96_052268, partial [Rhipicephalus microplus]